jgi:hypothetical protein
MVPLPPSEKRNVTIRLFEADMSPSTAPSIVYLCANRVTSAAIQRTRRVEPLSPVLLRAVAGIRHGSKNQLSFRD